MSWDVFVQDLPDGIASTAEIPDDFRPRPIGRRADLISKIQTIVATADFRDPAWGRIDADGYSIEINFGADEELTGFAFHARGDERAIAVVARILRHLGLRAIDPSSPTGLFDEATATTGLRD